jgi:hypothetical protein
MRIQDPAVIVLVTSLVALRVRDMTQIPFLTPKDQSELARRLGAQNPGYF